MSSATGIPQHVPGNDQDDSTEPLLGRPGDVTQADEAPIARNLVIGMVIPTSICQQLFLH